MKLLPISYFEKNPKSTRPIWGINVAADSPVVQVQGEVLLAIPRPNGGNPDALRVPQTWLPMELTRDIPRKRLLASSEFRSAVTKGLIGLISEEDAQRLLRQSGAKEEQKRLDAQTLNIRAAGAARTIADSGAEIARADGVKDDDDDSPTGRNKTVVIRDEEVNVAEAAANGVEDVEPGITPQFQMWVDRLCQGKDMTAKNEIKSKRRFKPEELAYLSRKLPRTFTLTLAMVNKNLGN